MVNAGGHNANFLLNIGPMPDGNIQPEFVDTLKEMGKWLRQYGESIYGTKGNIIPAQDWGVITAKDKFLFVHILKKTSQPFILVPLVNQKISKVILFADKKSLKFKQQPEGVFVYLDGISLDDTDTVIQLQVQ